jgi:hypothetical protein
LGLFEKSIEVATIERKREREKEGKKERASKTSGKKDGATQE